MDLDGTDKTGKWVGGSVYNNPTLSEVNVSYLARNIAPEVLSIQILPTNVGLLANPAVQIDPNIELSGLNPVDFGLPATMNIPPRKVYLRGARSLQWTAEDRNNDKLLYDIYYREVSETSFKLLRENLEDNFLRLTARHSRTDVIFSKLSPKIRFQIQTVLVCRAKGSANPLILTIRRRRFPISERRKSSATKRVFHLKQLTRQVI